MSEDATGFYSGWARTLVRCPLCGAEPEKDCDLTVEGYEEHGVHFARTESMPVGAAEEAGRKAYLADQKTRLEAMSTDELDEAVHDAKATEAAEINNSGREAQIAYLLGTA